MEQPSLQVFTEMDSDYWPSDLLNRLVYKEGLYHIKEEEWSTSQDLLECENLMASNMSSRKTMVVLQAPTGIGLAVRSQSSEKIHLKVFGKALNDVNNAFEHFRASFQITKKDDNRVPTTFWSHSNYGTDSRERSLQVPEWAEIRRNYPQKTLQDLQDLFACKDWSEHTGNLLLWQGIPGTGKTYALRALIGAWQEWCDFNYISDPESFLGTSNEYINNVLLDENNSDKWQLLIMEDAGELLALDAKEVQGQALSRLLNLTDGLLGQGLKFIILVTTNEKIRRLHPAVSRPGRAAGIAEFLHLSREEALNWSNKEFDLLEDKKFFTIAELYALKERSKNTLTRNLEKTTEPASFGF